MLNTSVTKLTAQMKTYVEEELGAPPELVPVMLNEAIQTHLHKVDALRIWNATWNISSVKCFQTPQLLLHLTDLQLHNGYSTRWSSVDSYAKLQSKRWWDVSNSTLGCKEEQFLNCVVCHWDQDGGFNKHINFDEAVGTLTSLNFVTFCCWPMDQSPVTQAMASSASPTAVFSWRQRSKWMRMTGLSQVREVQEFSQLHTYPHMMMLLKQQVQVSDQVVKLRPSQVSQVATSQVSQVWTLECTKWNHGSEISAKSIDGLVKWLEATKGAILNAVPSQLSHVSHVISWSVIIVVQTVVML